MIVEMGSSSPNRGKNQKKMKPPPSTQCLPLDFGIIENTMEGPASGRFSTISDIGYLHLWAGVAGFTFLNG